MSNGAKTRMERTRKLIVAAASDLFLKHGFLGTNMDEIAATAEVSKQTVYSHFQNKEALFLEVVRSMTGEQATNSRSRWPIPMATSGSRTSCSTMPPSC
ncbi:TetR/AcrR family transcriptional regulator [Ensifer adhaerens]